MSEPRTGQPSLCPAGDPVPCVHTTPDPSRTPMKGKAMHKCNVDYCLSPAPRYKRYCEWHDALTEVSP